MTEEQNDKILAYLHGELNATEEQLFEKHLEEDESLAQEYHAYKKLVNGLRENTYLETTSQVRALEQTLFPLEVEKQAGRPRAITRRLSIGLAAAASIALLALFTFQLFSDDATQSQLAADFYTPTDFISTRSTDASPYDKGFEAMENGREEQALQLLLSIPETDENFANAQYLLGHIYLRQEAYQKAVLQFEPFYSDSTLLQQLNLALEIDGLPRGISIEQVQWDLLIALTGAGNRKRAERLLHEILQNPDHLYQQAARELREQIR